MDSINKIFGGGDRSGVRPPHCCAWPSARGGAAAILVAASSARAAASSSRVPAGSNSFARTQVSDDRGCTDDRSAARARAQYSVERRCPLFTRLSSARTELGGEQRCAGGRAAVPGDLTAQAHVSRRSADHAELQLRCPMLEILLVRRHRLTELTVTARDLGHDAGFEPLELVATRRHHRCRDRRARAAAIAEFALGPGRRRRRARRARVRLGHRRRDRNGGCCAACVGIAVAAQLVTTLKLILKTVFRTDRRFDCRRTRAATRLQRESVTGGIREDETGRPTMCNPVC
jgi:hypothetical protein